MAKAIMIQGTMSNAGKSLLVGGLCRVLKQDGYRVAPFKSQNMALNSFITEDGLEMGRAQVMQAEAAGIKPTVHMNPILLKPTSDAGSQVIVNGEVIGNMSAWNYYKNKKRFIPAIMDAYHALEEEYDIIVLEGAGSPSEINLKENDIVNMGMAKLAKAPVLLVGDIDRGGVFAQLVGTIVLLEKEELSYVKGLVINKFRGDKDILMPGIEMLEERGGKPVLGVMPYVQVDIDEEDSLSERFGKKDASGCIDIAVIRLPRISNFTDFNVFGCFNEISLRYVSNVGQLGEPDIILLPGTKNTIQDLLWMRQNGLEGKILRHAAAGKIVFGICGGYQMLGESIFDPEGVEQKGKIRGMGLLPIHTTFCAEKTRTRVTGTFGKVEGMLKELSGTALEGYEIHMGLSKRIEDKAFLCSLEDITTGLASEQTKQKLDGAQAGNVYGSYVHGIFDAPDVVPKMVSILLKEKGLDTSGIQAFQMKEYKERQYNILADAVRQSLDMEAVYKIIEQGIQE